MDTRHGEPSREPAPRQVTDTQSIELVDLNVVPSSRRSTGAVALVIVAGVTVALIAGISALQGPEPAASGAAVASIGTDAPTAESSVAPTPTRTPRPRVTPPPTAGPTRLPWEFTPVELTEIDGTDPAVSQIWALADRFVIAVNPDVDSHDPDSRFLTSPDGLTWTSASSPVGGFAARAGTVVAGKLWLFGSVGPQLEEKWSLWTTTDAITWTRVSGMDGLGEDIADIKSIVRGETGWVAVVSVWRVNAECHVLCAGDELRFSPGGVHWRSISAPDLGEFPSFAGVATSGPLWVAVSDEPTSDPEGYGIVARTSTDGTTWSSGHLVAALQGGATGLAVMDARFVLIGYEETNEIRTRAWTSIDGVAWGYSGIGEQGDGVPRGEVITTPRGLLALGGYKTGQISLSGDGYNWENRPFLPPGVHEELWLVATLGDAVVIGGYLQGGPAKLWVGRLSALAG